MRKEFPKIISELFRKDDRLALLLGDIGVFSFKKLFEEYPERCFNVGILEQTMVGMASGMALSGLIPVLHTIAPFLVNRVHEQLKIDFGYQKVNGNFVSVGSSYDYASLGATHQAPDDVNILKQIPNFEIVVPGNGDEFRILFNQSYNSGNPTYYRLSDFPNTMNNVDVEFGRANIIKKGYKATVIVVGNLLDKVMNACWDKDVTILYYTTVSPFDYRTLKNNVLSGKILLCEPYYYGGLTNDIMSNIKEPLRIEYVGMPIRFLDNYGKKAEHDIDLGFSVENIKDRLEKLINE